jgi:FMN reductase
MVDGSQQNVPMYNPGDTHRTDTVQRLIDAYRRCDGTIIVSPGYDGCVSGLAKNALDYVEDLRSDHRVYFDGVAVGCIARAAGWQADGHTLSTPRSIAHALRGWPIVPRRRTKSSNKLFDETGDCLDPSAKAQPLSVGRQFVEFAMQRRALVD